MSPPASEPDPASEPEASESSGVWTGLGSVGAIALIVGCCAALPLIAAFAGSIAVVAVLGMGTGTVLPIALVGLVTMRSRLVNHGRRLLSTRSDCGNSVLGRSCSAPRPVALT